MISVCSRDLFAVHRLFELYLCNGSTFAYPLTLLEHLGFVSTPESAVSLLCCPALRMAYAYGSNYYHSQ